MMDMKAFMRNTEYGLHDILGGFNMTPKEFKIKAQELYDKYHGEAGEGGHIEIDDLLTDCLTSLGYEEGLEILWSMDDVWYA